MNDSTKYDKWIKEEASHLACGDPFLAEELRSEMHIKILGMDEGLPESDYYVTARYQAIEYLKGKWRFRPVSLQRKGFGNE